MKTRANGVMNTILGKKLDYKNYNASKQIAKVLYEKNYTKFTLFDNNRDINDTHVAELMSSMRKSGQLMPVVVTPDKEVIDGQHRLKACEKLGIPVSYVVNSMGNYKQIAVMNNTQKGWKNRDFLKHFSHSNHHNSAEYRKVAKFLDDYGLPFTVSIALLSSRSVAMGRGNNTGPLPSFRDGTFKIDDLEEARQTASRLVKLKSFVPHLVKIVKFSVAFIKISKLENFNLKTCYSQIEKNSNKFDKCLNQEDWNEAMVRAYNYKLVTKGKRASKRISIRKEGF
jgi:disulfide oxidoreductase YuzD|tara:strand:- start:161 stop:1009 length:849 start_codon:yes stop_codon:yes gene_type:complete